MFHTPQCGIFATFVAVIICVFWRFRRCCFDCLGRESRAVTMKQRDDSKKKTFQLIHHYLTDSECDIEYSVSQAVSINL